MTHTLYVTLPMEIPRNFTGVVQFPRLPGLIHSYQEGKLHSLEGPAITRPNGENEYYIFGEFFGSKELFNERIGTIISNMNFSTGRINKRELKGQLRN